MIKHVIIMAGGAGSRLWPASHSRRPKQFLKIGGEDSLIMKTIKRGFALGSDGYVIIITHKNYVDLVLEECSSLPPEKKERIVILPEPFAKNTAPALTLGALWLKSKGEEQSSVIVLAADHLIDPIEMFKESVEKAADLAENNWIVTFGITPTEPETGYGYIEAGDKISEGFKVISFKEKPNLEKAKEFLNEGNFYWNSGIFVYKITEFIQQLNNLSPEVLKPFVNLSFEDDFFEYTDSMYWMENLEKLKPVYNKVEAISIDYALMEKSQKIAMVNSSFNWNDIGSWDAISEIEENDRALTFSVDSNNNYVRSELPVSLCGVDDLIVVVENGNVLICKKDNSQLVKDAVTCIKSSNRTDLL